MWKDTSPSTGDQLASCVGVLNLVVMQIVVTAILNGWVLMIMWGWFIVPLFELPALRVVEAIGVSMVISMLTVKHEYKEDKHKTTEDRVSLVVAMLSYPVIVVLIGWIVHQFV